MNLLNSARLVTSCLALACSSVFAAEIVTTENYTAISFEAEEYISKDDRWVMTDANTTQSPPEEDPDPNHSGSASGGVYFEVLPDIRVTHEDPMSPPVAYWPRGGMGPEMTWAVTIPEPGRYYVHARAFSTGTEDNGMHVGIDGTWPASAGRMQFCTAGKRAWSWSSAQRDAGGVGSCGIQKTLYLDIETAGPHTISVSAREDGFELDRMVLIKDLSENTKTCSPTTATDISCRNGGIEMADEQTDLAVTLVTTPETIADGTDEISSGNSFTVHALLENHDKFDHATDIVVVIDLDEGFEATSVPAECAVDGQAVTCQLADLEPTAPNENHEFSVEVLANNAGAEVRAITATAENAVFDGNYNNNTASVDVNVAVEPIMTDISVSLQLQKDNGGDDLVWTVGEFGKLILAVKNDTNDDAGVVNVDVEVTDGVQVDLLPSECSGDTSFVCSFANLNANQTQLLQFEINAASAGTQVMSASTSVANDIDRSNDSASIIAQFEVAQVTEVPDTGADEPAADVDGANDPNAEPTDETSGGDSEGGVDGDETDRSVESSDDAESIKVIESSQSGAVSKQGILLLMLVLLTSVYWRHQRKLVVARNQLRRD